MRTRTRTSTRAEGRVRNRVKSQDMSTFRIYSPRLACTCKVATSGRSTRGLRSAASHRTVRQGAGIRIRCSALG
ncbi:hypothetical protein L226DRAFT_58829 [Lentinus tigrinus ALCF2SS1-7]|uniref:uncharacterized protein n=1 Tax=Lentinus tigrinus ALCF2SS1-7 TaxID=1328758 RepID=UPI00116614DC|nr:hypothetical protein L226DRAFT_58829 [Lentinus tigrinus ALCF2SS1-7]